MLPWFDATKCGGDEFIDLCWASLPTHEAETQTHEAGDVGTWLDGVLSSIFSLARREIVTFLGLMPLLKVYQRVVAWIWLDVSHGY